MKQQTNTALVMCAGLALALTLAIWSPIRAQAAEPADGEVMTEATMMEQCKAMQEQKQKMREEMKAQDAQLTEQLAQMNSAPADKKLDLLAAVVTKMAEQRIAMDARMAKMQQEMMPHMMQHMQMGKESMAQCPTMKGMKDMKDMKDMKGMKGMGGMKGMDAKPAGEQKEPPKEQK